MKSEKASGYFWTCQVLPVVFGHDFPQGLKFYEVRDKKQALSNQLSTLEAVGTHLDIYLDILPEYLPLNVRR